MAKQNPAPRKVEQAAPQQAQRARVTAVAVEKKPFFQGESEPLIFGRGNYTWMAIGAALIFGGLMLMLGGQQPNADTWDPNIIYSFRIITLAPIVIVAGVIVEIYAIFKD
jgi:hypothetical protein